MGNHDNPNEMWPKPNVEKLFLLCVDKHAPLRNKPVFAFANQLGLLRNLKSVCVEEILKLKATPLRQGDADDWRKLKN